MNNTLKISIGELRGLIRESIHFDSLLSKLNNNSILLKGLARSFFNSSGIIVDKNVKIISKIKGSEKEGFATWGCVISSKGEPVAFVVTIESSEAIKSTKNRKKEKDNLKDKKDDDEEDSLSTGAAKSGGFFTKVLSKLGDWLSLRKEKFTEAKDDSPQTLDVIKNTQIKDVALRIAKQLDLRLNSILSKETITRAGRKVVIPGDDFNLILQVFINTKGDI